jgi:hypothetical protein
MNDIVFITSCSTILYENLIYGKCLRSWDQIPYRKILFSEDNLVISKFEIINLNNLIDEHGFFKTKKRKGVVRRFYRKALSIFYALKNFNNRYIVWLDADVEVKKKLDVWPNNLSDINSLFYPRNEEEARDPLNFNKYGLDTGMIIFNKKSLPTDFADKFIDYWHNEKIYDYRGKDTTVISDMIEKYNCSNLIIDYSLKPSGFNYFDQTIFKDYLEHYIGRGNK